VSKRITQEREPRPHVKCAHDLCIEPAILSRKLKGGWANLCKRHELFHIQQEADEFCRVKNLTTRLAQMAFIREKLTPKDSPRVHWERVLQTHGLAPIAYEMARNYLRGRGYEREAGQDDEEVAA